jgi:ankyrin repeat protein
LDDVFLERLEEAAMPDSRMYEAVKDNDIVGLREYLRLNPSMLGDIDDGGYTILMEAAKQGRLEIVQYLVDLGADVDAYSEVIDGYRDERGTALAFALAHFHREVAMFLIGRAKASVNTAYYLREGDGTPDYVKEHRTSFMYAMDEMDFEMLDLMVINGLELNDFNAFSPCDEDEIPPLFYAIYEVKPAIVKWLLGKGANPLKAYEICDLGEVTALMYAVHLGIIRKTKIDERYVIVDMLRKEGADFSRSFDGLDSQTILDLVLGSGNDDYIRLFGPQSIAEKPTAMLKKHN